MKSYGFIDKYSYKDGHYEDSGLSPEEREKACIEAEEECKKLKSWEDAIEYDLKHNN